MSSKKDMRRDDLVIPYKEPTKEKAEGGDVTSTISTTLPMIAMFTRNKWEYRNNGVLLADSLVEQNDRMGFAGFCHPNMACTDTRAGRKEWNAWMDDCGNGTTSRWNNIFATIHATPQQPGYD